MKNLLVFRFSAMGDVALLMPVLQAVIGQNPDLKMTLITRKKFAVFFQDIPNVKVFEVDFEVKHKGFFGLWQLFRQLTKKEKFDVVLDVHQNLRTAILKLFFKLSGTKTFTINKGRAKKKALTRKQNKVFKQLPHTVERYFDVFEKAGIVVVGNRQWAMGNGQNAENLQLNNVTTQPLNNSPKIGIAPFAQHEQKMWHFENFYPLITKIYEKFPEAEIYLFGGGKPEIEKLENLQKPFPKTILIAGKMSLGEELKLIKTLDLMICMDSGNMHLAALSGVPVLSIWGATHPFAGFAPFGQTERNILQISYEELPCRPCSVFGNKPCWRGDLACMTRISPEIVMERIRELLP